MGKRMELQTFALDYDETFSANPDMWRQFAEIMTLLGHTVIGVTLRNREQLIEDPRYAESCQKIIYCAGRAKRPLLEDMDIWVDVWIDDKPEYIIDSWEGINGFGFEWPDGEHPDDSSLEPLVVETN